MPNEPTWDDTTEATPTWDETAPVESDVPVAVTDAQPPQSAAQAIGTGLKEILFGRNAAEALRETISGFVPKSVGQFAEMATPIYGSRNAIKEAALTVQDVASGTPIQEAVETNIPQSQIIAEAEKTPAYSRERFLAGFGIAGQLGTAPFVAKGISPKIEPVLKSTLFPEETVAPELPPQTVATNEALTRLAEKPKEQPSLEGTTTEAAPPPLAEPAEAKPIAHGKPSEFTDQKTVDLTEDRQAAPQQTLAIRIDDGTILYAGDTRLHSQILERSGVDPSRVVDSGFYKPISKEFVSHAPDTVEVFPKPDKIPTQDEFAAQAEPVAPTEAPKGLTFTEEQNLSANLSRVSANLSPLRTKAQVEETVGLRPISEVNQTIDSVRKSMVTKEEAFRERLKGLEQGSQIGAKAATTATRETLRTTDKWLEADRDAIRTELLSFSKNLPLNERAKLLPVITSALRRPSIMTRDPAVMYRRAEDVLNRITEKVYDVHKNERTAEIEKLIDRVENSPSITVGEKQAVRQRANFFNNMKEKMSLDMLDQMHANMAETERMGRDLYVLGDVIQTERANATLREIAQQGVRKEDFLQESGPELGEVATYWDKQMEKFRKVPDLIKHFNFNITPIDWMIQTFDGRPQGALYRTLRVPSDVKYGEYLNAGDAFKERLLQAVQKHKLNEGQGNRIVAHAELRQEGGLENLKASGYTDAEINSAKTLTRPELEALREADAILGELHPIAEQVLKEHFNQELPKVQGYFPRQRDRSLYDSLSIEEGRLVQAFNRTTTKAGSTIERTPGAVGKNKMDFVEIMMNHIDDLMYHIKVGPEVARMAKVVGSEEFKNLVGSRGQKQFADWIDVLSRNGQVSAGRRNRVADMITKNVGVGQLAFRLSTIFLQPFAIIPSMGIVSPKNIGMALTNYVKAGNRNFILKNMPEIRHRFGEDPAMYGYKGKSIRDKAARAGFKPIGELDRFAAMVVGEGAYRDNLASRGIPFDINKPDPTAIQYAQQTVRKTQSSPFKKDVSLSQSRGNLTGSVSGETMLTQFQNYIINRWSYFKNGALQLGIKEKNPVTGARIFAALMLGTIAEQVGRDGLKRFQQAVLGTTPAQEQEAKRNEKADKGYVRQIAEKSALDFAFSAPGLTNIRGITQYDGSGIPAVDVTTDIFKEGAKVFTSTKPETKISGGIRAVQGVGSAVGLPTSQAGDIAVQVVKANVRTKSTKGKKAKEFINE